MSRGPNFSLRISMEEQASVDAVADELRSMTTDELADEARLVGLDPSSFSLNRPGRCTAIRLLIAYGMKARRARLDEAERFITELERSRPASAGDRMRAQRKERERERRKKS